MTTTTTNQFDYVVLRVENSKVLVTVEAQNNTWMTVFSFPYAGEAIGEVTATLKSMWFEMFEGDDQYILLTVYGLQN